MAKEIYVVVDKETKKQVGIGFEKRMDAKSKRNELQSKTKMGLPKEKVEDSSQWAFKVSNGKDHPVNPTKH